MSEYKVKDYISKKFNDILKKEPTFQAYNLGMAVGMLELYKDWERNFGKENVNKYFKNVLEGTEEFNVVFKTMVGLYNEETKSKVESLIESFEEYKKPNKEMSDEHRDLIEEFLEYLYKKEKF